MEKEEKPAGAGPLLRIPAPITSKAGFGDVFKRITAAVGVKPCGGCQKRAERLNGLVVFTPWRGK